MTDSEPTNACEQPPLSARRIELKDGRYMIFFEFEDGDGAEAPTDVKPAPEPMQNNV
jgi:hypothetical protein